jgi:hypothetical protein
VFFFVYPVVTQFKCDLDATFHHLSCEELSKGIDPCELLITFFFNGLINATEFSSFSVFLAGFRIEIFVQARLHKNRRSSCVSSKSHRSFKLFHSTQIKIMMCHRTMLFLLMYLETLPDAVISFSLTNQLCTYRCYPWCLFVAESAESAGPVDWCVVSLLFFCLFVCRSDSLLYTSEARSTRLSPTNLQPGV